jgi:predicted SnoaL-like aldol condensation-catalyzing enzyme
VPKNLSERLIIEQRLSHSHIKGILKMKLYFLLISVSLTVLLSGCGGNGEGKKNSSARAIPSSSANSSNAKSEAATASTTSNSLASSSTSSSAVNTSSTASESVACTTQECESQNKTLVLKIYSEVINKKQVDLLESLFDTNVTLHITGANSGSTGEASHLQTLKNNNPAYVATVKHIGADGDYVAVHWHMSAKPDNEFNGKAVVDVYKLTRGKVVDHWHLTQNLNEPTASGNSLFSDLYKYTDTKPLATQESEAANKLLVTSTYLGLFNDKNLSLIDQNIAPGYLQHNPYVSNGSEALRNFVSSRTPGGLSFFATISDDDLVWTFGGNGNLTLVDIFRVDNKKIVEHYDVF